MVVDWVGPARLEPQFHISLTLHIPWGICSPDFKKSIVFEWYGNSGVTVNSYTLNGFLLGLGLIFPYCVLQLFKINGFADVFVEPIFDAFFLVTVADHCGQRKDWCILV